MPWLGPASVQYSGGRAVDSLLSFHLLSSLALVVIIPRKSDPLQCLSRAGSNRSRIHLFLVLLFPDHHFSSQGDRVLSLMIEGAEPEAMRPNRSFLRRRRYQYYYFGVLQKLCQHSSLLPVTLLPLSLAAARRLRMHGLEYRSDVVSSTSFTVAGFCCSRKVLQVPANVFFVFCLLSWQKRMASETIIAYDRNYNEFINQFITLN